MPEGWQFDLGHAGTILRDVISRELRLSLQQRSYLIEVEPSTGTTDSFRTRSSVTPVLGVS
jgi:hypothetical protein